MRYLILMDAEIRREEAPQEIELPGACAVCNGSVAARFTQEGGKGVCVSCHLITTLMIVRREDGIQLGHVPGGIA